MTARRRSKKPRRKPPSKPDESVPRPRISEEEEADEEDVLETPKQLEEKLAFLDRTTTDLASRMVDAFLGEAPGKKGGDDALHIRLRKRELPDIAQAVRQFAHFYFEPLFADANSKFRDFDRRIEQSDALRNLIGYDQPSLKQLGILLETLALEYMMGLKIGFSPSEKLAEKFSTLPIPELEERTETLRAAAQYLIDDSHSGLFAASLRDKKLASQLVQPVFNYSLVLKTAKQMQQELLGKSRKRGRPVDPFGRFIEIAYPILEPLHDPRRLDLIVTFGSEFFGEKTNRRKLSERLTHAGVRRPR